MKRFYWDHDDHDSMMTSWNDKALEASIGRPTAIQSTDSSVPALVKSTAV